MHSYTRIPSFLFAFFCFFVAQGQDWQTPYQSALKAFQQENYEVAMREAEKAIALASTDIKGQAYARQIFTASCLETQTYEKGLAEIAKEIENFRSLEAKGPNHLEAIHKKGQLLMAAGSYEGAATAFRELQTLIAETGGKQSLAYFVSMAEEADALMQAKKYEDAQRIYGPTIAGFKTLPDAGEDYLYALFNSAYIDFIGSNAPAASAKLTELIAFLERNNLQEYPEYEEARRMLSTLNVKAGAASTGLILPEDKARQLFEKAFAVQQQDYQEGLRHYDEAEKVITENKLINNTTFSSFLNHARLLFAVGLYEESAAKLELARKQAAQLYDAQSPEQGHVHILTADLALHAGNVAKAFPLYESGIRSIRTEPSTVWIKQVRWVAEQLIAAKAGKEAMAVLAIVLKDPVYTSFETRDKIVLHQLNGKAHLEARVADKLIAYYRPLAFAEKDADLKQAYFLLAAMGENEKANVTQAQMLLLNGITAAPNGIVSGELYFEVARVYQALGDYKQAEIHYRKALELIGQSPSAETSMPVLFNSLATFYIQMGNYSAAEKFFLNLLSHDNGSQGFFNAVRQNLAALYQQTGRYDQAKKLLLTTLRLDATTGKDHPDYAIALQNLAAVYQNLNQLDSAQLLYAQALEIDRKQFGEQSLSFATKLANLGTVYQESNNFSAAREMFEKSLAIRKNLLPADHPDYAFSQYTLANLLYRTQKPAQALPLFKAAADYYIRQIQDVFPALSDAERMAFYNRVYEVIATYEMFLLENLDMEKGLASALLNFRLQTKALLLNSSLKVRHQILQSGDEELIRDFSVWQHTKEQLAYLYTLSKEERAEHAALIEEFTENANTLEKSLSLKAENFASTFVNDGGDWKEIQRALKPGEGAMEIVRVKLKDRDSVLYAALMVKPGLAEPMVAIMADGNFLEQKAFNAYINSIRYKVEDHRSYGLFWKRLGPLLDGVQTLYLSPDGVYTKINIVTLYDPATKKFLVDRMKVTLTSNLRDLTRKTASQVVAGRAMLVGFPDYRLDAAKGLDDVATTGTTRSAYGGNFTNSFTKLPGTAAEIEKIQKALTSKNWNVEAYLRENALEQKIKEGQNITLLHIATHGFFVAPKDEHAKQVYSNDIKDIDNNSMLRSGLILAGAEKSLVEMLTGQPKSQAEDGILTAYEVMNLNLDDADLVVLSACETGTGDVKNGEGVYGLQRAFLLAGAKSVVMSLWKVDDDATQELMSAFYEAWLSGMGQAEAFHQAQLNIKEKYPQPYHWGAFVMMGK